MPGAKRKPVRQTGLYVLVGGALLFGLSCGGGPQDPSAPGTLRITTATSGPFPDPDGYGISLDGTGLHPAEPSGTILISDITPGYHTVALVGLEVNCTVVNGDSHTLEIPAGKLIPVGFTISCVMPEHFSILHVSTTTVGASLDPDGYVARIDQGPGQPLAIQDLKEMPQQTPGIHSVLLEGLASNCEVVFGDNPVQVRIGAAYIVEAHFTVACSRVGP